MASPESIAAAFARGLMEAMLGAEKPAREKRPAVVKADDVKAAIREVLPQLLLQMDAEAQQPVQEPLFPEPQIDAGEAVLRAVHEARARAAAMENGDPHEPPPGTFYPDRPDGAPWQSPVR